MADFVRFKAIKPKALKAQAMRLELLNELRKVGGEVKKDFEATTSTWENKPKFEQIISLSGGAGVLVGTDDEIYRYVDEGTKPHDIFPKSGKVLSFKTGHKAKTQPGVIGSGSGGSSGSQIFRPYVRHPGTKPRGFAKAIEKKWHRKYPDRMEKAMHRAREKSGHAI